MVSTESTQDIDGVTANSPVNTLSIKNLSHETRSIVRSYYGKFAWFSVLYQIFLLFVYFSSIYYATVGHLPLWAGCIISSLCAYYSLGPLHDAMHGNVSGKGASIDEAPWFDTIFGWVSSIPLIMPFSAYRMLHYRHHAHTNDPKSDPDYYLAANNWRQAAWQALLRRLVLITTMVRRGPKVRLSEKPKVRRAKLVMVLINYTSLLALVASAYFGYFSEVFFLWYLPSKIATLFAEILTGYLPHHPFQSRAHFEHSRIVHFWGSTVLLFGHDHHALHHLFPRIPFYKYAEAFARIRPELETNGVRVENLNWFGNQDARKQRTV